LDLGYFTLTDICPGYGPARTPADQKVRDVVEESVLAEDMGFASAWLPEHHFGLFGCLPATAVALASVAARTRRIRLAPAVAVLPCADPLRLAEEYALLDVLSGGRVEFAAGRGYDEREYRAFESPFAESPERFREGLDLIRRAWTEEDFTFQGRFRHITDPITLLPRPVQRPHPRISVACFSRVSMDIALEDGYDILFAPFAAAMMFGSVQDGAKAFLQRARPGSQVKCSYFTALCHTHREEQEARERLIKYFRGIVPAFPKDPENTPPHIRYFIDIVRTLEGMQPGDLGEKSIVLGDAERCIATLEKCREGGVSEVILYFNFGDLPHAETVRSMERVAREILPHFSTGTA
jgi:alkanesulfonate monooxygenase SsuD/methylene tetrahydromethanopterin reductase-like flavin-dependent oxidoreductase (luciferase family)